MKKLNMYKKFYLLNLSRAKTGSSLLVARGSELGDDRTEREKATTNFTKVISLKILLFVSISLYSVYSVYSFNFLSIHTRQIFYLVMCA